MQLLNPRKFDPKAFKDRASGELLLKTIDFFEKKGKAKLKHDDQERTWYQDFLEFSKESGLFSTFLTPTDYNSGARWDTYRNCHLNEILGFYGLPYWYTWQVTILGLGPIWMSKNEEIKKRTADLLKKGEVFGFGLSEKDHGADIYSTEMKIELNGAGGYNANGRKYYIGNGNKAA